MAIIGKSAVMCSQIIMRKSGVFCASVPSQRVCFNGWKLRDHKSGIVVKAMAHIDVGSTTEWSWNLKGFEGTLGFDLVSEGELRNNGFMGLRKTKLVCTIGPACCRLDELENLALGGMNVARLNMCHNTREWHLDVLKKIKKLNGKGYCVAVMIDAEGSLMHVVDHGTPSFVNAEVIQRTFCIFDASAARL